MSGILQSFAYGRAFTSPPVNVSVPVISGTAQARQTLSCSTGTWTGLPTPTFTYQWQFGTTNISGATSNSYTVAGTYVGQTLRCVVTATNSSGAVSANSNATATVTANTPAAPTIGTATATAYNTATVSYTAPSENGGATITTYTATSSPGSITGTLSTAGSGTITVTGLSGSTNYTFTVTATNSVGVGPASAASNTISTPVQQFYYVMQSYLRQGYDTPAAQLFVQQSTTGPLIQLETGGDGSAGSRYAYGVINTSNLTINTSATVQQTTVPSTNFGAYAGSSYNYAMFNGYGRQEPAGMYLGRVDNVGSGTPSQGFLYSYNFTGRANAGSSNDMFGLTYDSSANQVITIFAWPKLIYVPCCCGFNVNVYVGAIVKTNAATGAATWGIAANFTGAYNTAQMYLYAVAVHPANGNIYVVGQAAIDCVGTQSYIAKFNSSGTLQWHKYYSQSTGTTSFNTIAIDSSENLYVGSDRGTVYKLNSSGTFQWGTAVGSGTSGGTASTIKIGSDGSVYVQGSYYNGTQSQGIINKLNSSGTVQWQRTWYNNTTANAGNFPRNALALDSSNNLYLGLQSVATGGRYANVTFKVAPDGSGASGAARYITNPSNQQSYIYAETTKAVTSVSLGGGTDVGSKYSWATFTVSAGTSISTGVSSSSNFTPLATVQII
jgi:hypothetical protein